ncbi:MAG: hypothetical protein JRI68_01110 [Deltaproteobacteria bacterium]|nr:hypothetical protein [Deltaproteobacteria bacterium]
MNSTRLQWGLLADELGFEFKPGVRGMLESKLADRIARQQGQDPSQIASVMNNGLLMGVLDKVFLGVAMGTFRDYDFYVYRNSRSSSSSGSGTYSVHVQLFFPKAADLGLSIYRERFWSKVGKFLGAQDIQSGNADLDPLVMIKAEAEGQAQRMMQEPELQRALLGLFRFSDGFEVDDSGIEHRTYGASILGAAEVRDLAERMVDAAEDIRPALCI